MKNQELENIRQRLANVTPGEWKAYVEGRDFTSGSSFIMVEEGGQRKDDIEIAGASETDIDFIAHARKDVAKLLDEIDRLNKLLAS